MIGTRATGRNKTYRYYTCWSLARYDASKCDFKRLNADAVDVAILDALATFYRTRHDLIQAAITAEQAQHRAAHADRHAELATVDAEITKTGQAIDRYLTAFERGTMDEDLVADRLNQLRATTKQLRIRRDELTLALNDEPTTPEPATLAAVADHVAEIITSGTHNQTKALVEALVAQVTITGPDRLIPVFRIPQPRNEDGAATAVPAETAPEGVVRTMTNSVVQAGQRLNPSLRRYLRGWRRRDPVDVALRAESAMPPELPTPQALYDRLPLKVQAAIVAGFLAGTSKSELAKTFGVSRSGVATLLRKHGVIEP